MLQIPVNVLKVLKQLVPASVLKEIMCYVFYDDHPRDERNIDIIVCTEMGDIREYFHRDLLCSIYIGKIVEASEIKILRNSKCELFYLVSVGNELIVLSRTDKLQIQNKFAHVSKYDICDETCSGRTLLRIESNGCYRLLVPDDNFKELKSPDFPSPHDNSLVDQESPVIKHLMSKIIESKHTAECIKKTYKDFLKIRQSVAFSTYKKTHPNLDNSVFQDDPGVIASAINVHFQKLWIKSCNKKIVIAYNICNSNKESLEDVHILLHGTTRSSLEYTTKIFEKINTPPFWKETVPHILKPNIESALVVVMKLKEIKDSVLSKVEFNGVIVFKKSGLECTLPIEDVYLSSIDAMGEQFDVLCNDSIDDEIFLAILASTEKTDLIMRHIHNEKLFTSTTQEALSFGIFCEYLHMENILNAENIVIFRKSPYHILNGVMIILNSKGEHRLVVTVHSRSPSQVLALIHYLHDAVPYKIVTTTPEYTITVENDNLSINDEKLDDLPAYMYQNYATSILDRTNLVLEYLDNSMIHMSESKSAGIRNKIGKEIDLFAQGEVSYKKFKEEMWAKASTGVKILMGDLVAHPLSDDINMEL